MIKKLKSSGRGLTFSFAPEKNFAPGDRYRYLIDLEGKEVIILPSGDGGNTVSRKRNGKEIRSLIDIRNRAVRELAAGCGYMSVSFEGEKIRVVFCEAEAAGEGIITLRARDREDEVLSVSRELLMAAGGENIRITRKMPDVSCHISSDDREKSRVKDAIRVASLFSGAGMLDYAFAEDSRFSIVYAAEYDPDAARTYRENIGGHVRQTDIRQVKGEEIPQADVLIGGPPCQPVSNANRHEDARYEAHREGDMFAHYIRLVEECGVKVFAIENVPGLITARDGYYMDMLKERLPQYQLAADVITDCDLGGYTKRKRCVIIGSRIGEPIIRKLAIRPWRTVKDALRKVNASWPNAADITKSSDTVKKKIAMIPEGGNWRDLPEEFWTKSVHSNMYRRLDRNKPAITIANWRKCCVSPPRWDDTGEWDRILSVSEASALQGFGPGFKFLGSINAMQQQVANGVTLATGRFIRGIVAELIERYRLQNGRDIPRRVLTTPA